MITAKDYINRHWVFVDIRALCTSLDGGEVFAPRPLWDIRMNIKFMNRLKELHPNAVMIVDNVPYWQPSYEQNLFGGQLGWIIACVQEAVGSNVWVGGQYSPSNDEIKDRHFPGTAMLESIFRDCVARFSQENEVKPITLDDCLYIGANGDGRQAAKALGIPYATPEEFYDALIPTPRYRVVNTTTLKTAEGRSDRKKLVNLSLEQANTRVEELNKQTGMLLFAPVAMHWRPSDAVIPHSGITIEPVKENNKNGGNEKGE